MQYKLIKPINKSYSIIEQILTNRGISLTQISHYLNTADSDINPPEALGQDKLQAAASVLIQTIKFNEHAVIVVDSDADGFTSSAILINYLHDLFPAWVKNSLTYILHIGKQHGLNDHIDELIEKEKWDSKFGLVILPDAGSNDTEECTRLKEKGINTIILDHHLCDTNNSDAIVINNQLSNYPNKDLSGAGVTWQFCRYLDKLLQINNADNYLDLVALGLCADMMSMTSIETKHLVNKGFHNVKNPFFFNLSEKNSYSMNGKINHTSVAFYVAPYINAICRSGTVQQKQLVFESMLKHKAFTVLPSTKRGHFLGDTQTLVEQAMRVVTNVKNRQTKAQQSGLELLEKKIETQNLLNHKVLLFLLEPGQIDRNIAGLIANKLMAKYQRPVCILTATIEQKEITGPVKVAFIPKEDYNKKPILEWEEPPFDPPYKMIVKSYQGSARGCEKVGITDFKKICADTGVTEYQTGHPNAFGLGILQKNIQTFISKTDAALKEISDEAVYYVDYIYEGNDIKAQDLLSIADMEEIWGKDVQEPFLCIQHLKVSADMVTVYEKRDNTLKITLPNGISLMKFKATTEQCYKLQNTPGYYEMNIIGRANKNEWMGNITAQLFIEDYQIIDSKEWFF